MAAARLRRMPTREALALVALGLMQSGCPSTEGRMFSCACTFLTDFDDGSRADVEVCAPTLERAAPIGRGCAQSGAPAAVQGCTCAPIASAALCRVGDCRAPRADYSAR